MSADLTQKVSVDQLRVGIFVHLDLPWMQHPFLTSSFKIRTEKQLEVLRALDLEQVRFDPERSDCAPLQSAPPAAAPPPLAEAEPHHAWTGQGDSRADSTALAYPKTDAVTAAFWEEKNRRILKLKERRARLNQCAKRYTSSVSAARKLFPMMQAMPGQAAREATELVTEMVSELALDQDATVQLVNLKHLGENSYFHAINVVALALVVGTDLKLSPNELRLLGLGALFHDLGHQQLPSQLLLKRAPFSPAELRVYRQHPVFGVQLARKVQTLPHAVVEVIANHHEHLDGSGFPRGLGDRDLGTLTRIISVVNRYDNLCNGFAAQRGLSPHQAISSMYRREKSWYDEKVLSVFISSLGIYPPGTVVRLDDERLAVVTSVNRDHPSRPNVLVYEPEIPKEEALILDLSEENIAVRESLHADALSPDQVDYLNVSDKLSYYFQKKKRPKSA